MDKNIPPPPINPENVLISTLVQGIMFLETKHDLDQDSLEQLITYSKQIIYSAENKIKIQKEKQKNQCKVIDVSEFIDQIKDENN